MKTQTIVSKAAIIGTLFTLLIVPLASAQAKKKEVVIPSASDIAEQRKREAAVAADGAAQAEKLRIENEKRLADIAAERKDRDEAAIQKAAADQTQKLAQDLLTQAAASKTALAAKQQTVDRALAEAEARQNELTEAEREQKTAKADLNAARTEHSASRIEHGNEKTALLNDKASIERDKSAVEIRERIWSAGALGLVFTNIFALLSLMHARRSGKLDDELKTWQIREIRQRLETPPVAPEPAQPNAKMG